MSSVAAIRSMVNHALGIVRVACVSGVHTHMHTHMHTHTQPASHTDRQTDRQTDTYARMHTGNEHSLWSVSTPKPKTRLLGAQTRLVKCTINHEVLNRTEAVANPHFLKCWTSVYTIQPANYSIQAYVQTAQIYQNPTPCSVGKNLIHGHREHDSQYSTHGVTEWRVQATTASCTREWFICRPYNLLLFSLTLFQTVELCK